MYDWNNINLNKALGIDISFKFEGRRVITDSRKIEKNDIFFALRGENFDGNKFAVEAIEKGASAAVVDDKNIKHEKFIQVENTLAALQKIAKWRRKNSKAKFIAITGSVGKTGTKEMLFAALSTKYKTYHSEGNFNNHIGLPLTLANMPDDIEYAVLEMGMNHAGEISELVRIGKPHISGITWIGEAHIENLGSRENIAKAKAEIFEWMANPSSAVIPADNDFFELLHELAEANNVTNIISFGKIINHVKKTKNGVLANFSEEIIIPNSVIEDQVLNNVLLVLSICDICDIDLKSAISSIEKLGAYKGRGQKIKLKNGAVIIDDSYNASPTSMKLALEKFADEKAERKIAVLGEMKELGEFSKKYHEQIADYIKNVDLVLTCGNDMQFLHDRLDRKIKSKYFENHQKLTEFLKAKLKKGDMALIKGSHGSNMYKVVSALNSF